MDLFPSSVNVVVLVVAFRGHSMICSAHLSKATLPFRHKNFSLTVLNVILLVYLSSLFSSLIKKHSDDHGEIRR